MDIAHKKPIELDELDGEILELLQADASLGTAAIAAKAGLSQAPCWRRIRRLEAEGVILKRVTLLEELT